MKHNRNSLIPDNSFDDCTRDTIRPMIIAVASECIPSSAEEPEVALPDDALLIGLTYAPTCEKQK